MNRALASLYQDANWSHQDINTFISVTKEQMTKATESLYTAEKIKYYYDEVKAKEDAGYIVSFIDMAGLILEELVFGRVSS